MDLTTRCPRCGTEFQASLADLQLRKGYIRCVQCAHIFDGYAEVVSAPPEPSEPSLPVAAPPTSPAVAVDRPPHTVPSVPPPAHAPDIQPDELYVPDSARPDPDGPQVFRSGRSVPPPEVPLEPPHWRVEPQFDSDRRPPEPFVVEARPGHRSQGGSAAPLMQSARQGPGWWDRLVRLLSGLVLLILLLLAVAQLAYVYRTNLAQAVPALRPWLLQACVPLRCQVPYARNLGQLTITGSALKLQDPLPNAPPDTADAAAADTPPVDPLADTAQHYVLQATLRNQADYPQEWPSLILDLKDAAGTLLVRRNVTAAEYLGADAARQPFAAHSDVLIRLPFTLNGLIINGYQLDLFYP
ncbi:zinc-ribbon and DUF3426 domain-containing protein [Castellaniella sp.]|uniref:zinc-ribbon and DUF3426 domain-containing protein n=1 Tax=Castellaniella sp. TaxID=1955812 RepID=UPI002AFFEDBC|nr:zinc-ribbon and DUF3426 domain-containing protein [Castellaniella sp.]